MKVRKNNTRKRRTLGFSLLELLAVVTILGIIAVVVIPRIAVSSSVAKENAQAQAVSEINSALERYYFDYNAFPLDLAALFGAVALPVPPATVGQPYFPDGAPKNPKTGLVADFNYSKTTGRVSGK
ncbi:MAG: type II secretion system protein [Planctomycetota bacterium]|nr:type II secretion system protein [Planctomycetota bacterium]